MVGQIIGGGDRHLQQVSFRHLRDVSLQSETAEKEEVNANCADAR